jgi:hypothetical protein
MKITLVSSAVRFHESQLRLDANAVITKIDGPPEELEEWLEEIRKFVKDEKQYFSEIKEVQGVLQNPDVQRNTNGTPKLDAKGQATPIPFKRKAMKANSQILRILNAALDKLDSDLPFMEIPELSFDLTPELATHLAGRVIKRCDNEYTMASPLILDFQEKFESVEEKANAAIEAAEKKEK